MKEKKYIFFSIISFLAAVFFFYEAVTSKQFIYDFPFVGYGGTFAINAIKIGSTSISLYWIAMLIGLILMTAFCIKRRNLIGITKVQGFVLGLLLGVLGFVGAKILYILENFEETIAHGINLSGVSFFGTVFFMPAVIPLIAVFMKVKPLKMLDFCTPAGILMLTCIRIGCFLNGCCGGKTLWFFDNPIVIPAQLIEVTFDFLLIYLILYIEKEGKCIGIRYAVFIGTYGIYRYFIEFIRDTKVHFGIFTNGQHFAMAAVLAFIVTLIIKRKRGERV